MTNRTNVLYEAFASQVQQLQGVEVSDDAIESYLTAMTAGGVSTVPGATYSCITLVERGIVATMAPTDEIASRLDELQGKHEHGPCLDAAWKQRIIRIDDYTTDDRWPNYVSDVVAQTPVRSSLCFPLHREGSAMSSLNLHSTQPNAFDAHAVEIGRTFATQAALAMQSDSRTLQFSEALASRDTIGQAKGILMERYNLDADGAFQMLRQISQDTNVKVAELARRLVTIDHPACAS